MISKAAGSFTPVFLLVAVLIWIATAGILLTREPYPVGAAYEVLQSNCFDAGSHGNQLAYDFLMREGTPVAAARAGVVVALEDRWEDTDWDSSHFNPGLGPPHGSDR